MDIRRLVLILTSASPAQLLEFYRDVLGLPEVFDSGPGPGYEGGAVQIGGAILVIEGYSETAGQAQEPQRHLLDLHVDHLFAEQSRLQGLGVRFLRLGAKEDFGGLVATFEDPDGNYVQLVQDP